MFHTVASLVVVTLGMKLAVGCNPQTKIQLGGGEVEIQISRRSFPNDPEGAEDRPGPADSVH